MRQYDVVFRGRLIHPALRKHRLTGSFPGGGMTGSRALVMASTDLPQLGRLLQLRTEKFKLSRTASRVQAGAEVAAMAALAMTQLGALFPLLP